MPDSPFISRFVRDLDHILARAFPPVRSEEPRGVLIALSGGPDSVALLLAAKEWSESSGRPVQAAHLNHGLRGEAADADERFCADLCAAHDIALHRRSEDPRPVARLRGQGLEEAGRHLRRRFFRSLLAEHPRLCCVATGHHRDDQSETVIQRLFRGTGPDGLRGILPVQGETIHPLLGFDRREILAFLGERGQPWREDATNEQGSNVRSRLRRELLPLVRDIFGPGSDRQPARLAELLQGDLELLETVTETALAEAALPGALSVPPLLALDEALARRVLRRWLAEVRPGNDRDLELVHIVNILAWLREGSSGSRLDLPGEGVLRRDFERLEFRESNSARPPLRSAADFRILVSKPSAAEDPVDRARREAAADPWNLTCPASVLRGNLRIRNRREGDRFQPFGMDGSRKLSDLLRERRIPADERAAVLVVADDAGILWVVGLARAERTRLLPSTEQTVTLSVVEREH